MSITRERRRRQEGDKLAALKADLQTKFNGVKDGKAKLDKLKSDIGADADFDSTDVDDVQAVLDWYDTEKATL